MNRIKLFNERKSKPLVVKTFHATLHSYKGGSGAESKLVGGAAATDDKPKGKGTEIFL